MQYLSTHPPHSLILLHKTAKLITLGEYRGKFSSQVIDKASTFQGNCFPLHQGCGVGMVRKGTGTGEMLQVWLFKYYQIAKSQHESESPERVILVAFHWPHPSSTLKKGEAVLLKCTGFITCELNSSMDFNITASVTNVYRERTSVLIPDFPVERLYCFQRGSNLRPKQVSLTSHLNQILYWC